MGKRTKKRPPIQRVEADVKTGLNSQQVKERVDNGYVNVVTDKNDKTFLQILAGNTFTFFNAILLSIALVFIAFMIYLKAIGHDEIVNQYFGFSKFIFLIPAIMNVTMGTFQEVKSAKVIKKLRIVTETKGKVIRNGEVVQLDAKDIVIDDIVLLSAGDQASTDMVVLEGEVFVDESMLTGESDHVKKNAGDTILSGSSIIVGSAKCRATEIGNDTYAAKLTQKVKGQSSHKSELMTSIIKILRFLTVALFFVVVTVIITLVVKISQTGNNPDIWNNLTLTPNDPVTWALIAVTSGSFGIGMIPSGLVLTTSVALVVSIAQLTKKKTLIQELYSLENLSRVDVICLDKTGTLTDGTMNVVDVKAFAPMEEIQKYAQNIVLAAGDRNSTMEAVYQRFGIASEPAYVEDIPFSSANKYSGVILADGKKVLMGAPEYLIDKEDPRLEFSTECAKKGQRVVAITVDGELKAFIAIEDHIRDTAPDTLKFFRENGVEVKVISGDNPLTVSKIAENCGIKHADRYISLAGVSLDEIPEIADEYTVFARVSPEQKEALVRALQAKGHKVAMTGDGVNDILALRKADSSITFAKATDAAKACSDVVLLDNDFSHLKDVVGEGRRVIGNIQRTAVLYLMKSIAVFILGFALIPLEKGQLWFSVENMYMLEAAVIGTGGFLISLESQRNPIRGSFMKMIVLQALAAGILAAVAILTPIMLNVIPKMLSVAPFISDANVKPMMTVMMTMAGIVVIFAKCIPFNKYRIATLIALVFVASTLGFMFPSAYIGGHTIGSDMLAYDAAAGQSIFDSRLFHEMFQPWNSPYVQGVVGDYNNFVVLRIFLYIAIPVFILVMFALENFVRKDYGKDVHLHRAFRIGRRMMLTAGIVLVLRALLCGFELFFQNKSILNIPGVLGTIINIVCLISLLVIGYFGYKLWKDPTKTNIRIAAGMGIGLVVLSVLEIVISGGVLTETLVLYRFDQTIIWIITALYLVGSIIVRANYKLGLLKPRDK